MSVKAANSLVQLRELAKAEHEAYLAWLEEQPEDDNPEVIDMAPGQNYWAPLEAWLAGYEPEILPAAAEAMSELTRRYAHFNAIGEAMPDGDFWKARDKAHSFCFKEKPILRPKPSVAELHRQGVTAMQIARIWELRTPLGHEDTGAVAQELAEPGSVITPGYIAQLDAKRLAEEGWGPPPQAIKPKRKETKSAPNICELAREGVSVQQITGMIANHFKITDAERLGLLEKAIEDLALAADIELPHNAQQQLNAAGKEQARKLYGEKYVDREAPALPHVPEVEIDDQGEVIDQDSIEATGSIEAEVIGLIEQGHDVASVASAMSLSKRRVAKIVEEHQAQFK